MTGNSILPDTNIVIEMFKGDAAIAAFLNQHSDVCIAPAVLGELYLGAYRSLHTEKHTAQITGFLQKCTLLSADAETARNYALIKTDLLNKGRPIPENDIWIAATARQYSIELVTKDNHFKEIDSIALKLW